MQRSPRQQGGIRAYRVLAGLTIGLSASVILYFWQSSINLSVAAFVIVAHTVTVALHFHGAAMLDVHLRREMSVMRINHFDRRVGRMLADPYFWWSLVFGTGSITLACWFAGLRNPTVLTLIGCAWGGIAVILGYDVTLLYPTTRCRACGYQLIGLLDQSNPGQRLTCPECGRRWTKAQLCLVPPGWREASALAEKGGDTGGAVELQGEEETYREGDHDRACDAA